MEHTRLGDTGLKISRLALGCMSYGDPATEGAHRWAQPPHGSRGAPGAAELADVLEVLQALAAVHDMGWTSGGTAARATDILVGRSPRHIQLAVPWR